MQPAGQNLLAQVPHLTSHYTAASSKVCLCAGLGGGHNWLAVECVYSCQQLNRLVAVSASS